MLRIHSHEVAHAAPRLPQLATVLNTSLKRNQACPFCCKKVYGEERHALQCPVLMQLAVAHVLETSPLMELPDSAHTSRLQLFRARRSLLTCTALSPEATLAMKSLNQMCWLCARRGSCVHVVDVQTLKAHLRKHHAQEWKLVGRDLPGALLTVPVQRPCQFCFVQIQKILKVHSTKCLPLLQLHIASTLSDSLPPLPQLSRAADRGDLAGDDASPDGGHQRLTDDHGDRKDIQEAKATACHSSAVCGSSAPPCGRSSNRGGGGQLQAGP